MNRSDHTRARTHATNDVFHTNITSKSHNKKNKQANPDKNTSFPHKRTPSQVTGANANARASAANGSVPSLAIWEAYVANIIWIFFFSQK